jgi:hypothetical protein
MPKIIIELRRPSGSFPGQIAEGWYEVVDGHVVLTDESGKPLSDEKRFLPTPGDARLIACRMLRQRSQGSRTFRSGFGRKISYPKSGIC